MRNAKNIRTCKGCLEKKDKTKDELICIKYNKEKDELKIVECNIGDKSLFGNGKTMYVCKNNSCIEQVIKKKRIKAFFRKDIKDSEIDKLKTYITY